MYSNYDDEPKMTKIWVHCPCTRDGWEEAEEYCWDCGGSGGWVTLVEEEY